MCRILAILFALTLTAAGARAESPSFSRHVEAVFSRLGCNGGTCHGAVQGKNGFRLSLFGADPTFDHAQLWQHQARRRLDLFDPASSLLLLKATGQIEHGGGKLIGVGSPEYQLLRQWIADGARGDDSATARVVQLSVQPSTHTARPGETYRLQVKAKFAAGHSEDVTGLCSYQSLHPGVARVSSDGLVTTQNPGDAAIIIRYRAEPVLAQLSVPRTSTEAFPAIKPSHFIDRHILAKLRQLSIPPSDIADDATFLRRVTLDVCGELPTPAEVRAFLGDSSPEKRTRKIEELLRRSSHAALWTMKFCDLLKASDFGVYADGIRQEMDAPRFQAWIRARLEENVPYDALVERILTATSLEGRDAEAWAREVVQLEEGYQPGRPDIDLYRKRRTLDAYWQRNSATGVSAALQVAHAFLGLRLECAQCHRHPHDVWQQDDLLSFANFFMSVRKIGFQGENEKNYPEMAAIFKRLNNEAKEAAEQAKKFRGSEEYKNAEAAAKMAKADKQVQAKFEEMKKRAEQIDRRGKYLPEAARRLMHAEVRLLPLGKNFATVTSPIGTQSSKRYRLLGQSEDAQVGNGQDPRQLVMNWLRRPDNPYFARAIVNRVWAHYFGRGIIDPPDDLSPFNPPTHPALLDELARGFIDNKYDLQWMHRTILTSRTYQQSSTANKNNEFDRSNYAYFYYRRLPAEVLLDAVNQATGTKEDMDMVYYHWPKTMKVVEVPYATRNPFVEFMLTNFGRPKRNAAVQCDCEREDSASVLQVLSLANHPRLWHKISDEKGEVARIVKEIPGDRQRLDELFLLVLGRTPNQSEQQACLAHLARVSTPVKGYQGILWSLLNTREFLLQH